MIIEISSHLKLSNLPDRLIRKFSEDNTFRNPKFDQLKRLKKWDKKVKPRIILCRQVGDSLLLPRGYYRAATNQLRSAGLRFQVIDHTVCPRVEFDSPTGQLYPFQNRALDNLLKHAIGNVESPSGV